MTNDIHPSAVIGPDVVLGTDNVVGPFVVLAGTVRLGDGNWLGPHVVLGTPPEIRGFEHGAPWGGPGSGAGVVVGDRTVLREYTTVHSGSARPTTVGSDCFIMNKVYVGHDGEIGDRVTMASTVTLGGHVSVGAGANLGLGAAVHQRRVVGPGAMVGMGSVVTRDVLPFAAAYGNPARLRGVNRVGMQRAGIPDEVVEALQRSYAAGVASPPEDLRTGPLTAAWAWWDEHTSEA